MNKILGCLIITMLVAGCAYIDQNLQVAPTTNIATSSIGSGKPVELKVVDDRDQTIIGRRGSAYGPAAKIQTNQDLAGLLREAVADGLRRKGFALAQTGSPASSMRVELRTLAYDASMGLWTAGNVGSAVVKVIATAPSGKTYEKSYRGQREIRTAFVGSQETNANVINDALSDALDQVFSDEELLKNLAE